MNKLLLLCLLSGVLVVLTSDQDLTQHHSLAHHSQARTLREADPRKGGVKKTKKSRKAAKKNKHKRKNVSRKNKRKNKNSKTAKKKRKNNRKTSKKNKTNKKKSHKNQNKSQKNMNKSQKNKKKSQKNKKKSRKNKKKSGKNKTKAGRKQSGRTCMAAACVDNAVSYMKLLKDKIRNFKAQKARIATSMKQAGKKAGKAGLFVSLVSKIREAGGGNSSALKCNGATGPGADKLTNLTVELSACEAAINKSCSTDLPAYNTTKEDLCSGYIASFENLTLTAISTSGNSSCTLWQSANLSSLATNIKTCDISKHNSNFTKAKTSCTKAFGKCRKIEDTVSQVISACSAANTQTKVVAELTAGVSNKAAAAALTSKIANATGGMMGTINSTNTMNSTSSNNTSSNSTSSATNSTNSTNATSARTSSSSNSTNSTSSSNSTSSNTSCAAFTLQVGEMTNQTKNAPLSTSLEAMLKAVTAVLVSPCNSTEMTDLATAGTAFSAAAAVIDEAIAAKQMDLEISTGSTVSTSSLGNSTVSNSTATGRAHKMDVRSAMERFLRWSHA